MNNKIGSYWSITPGQDTSKVYTDMGKPKPVHPFTVPLTTIEAPAPFDETEVRFESVRYFQPKVEGDR